MNNIINSALILIVSLGVGLYLGTVAPVRPIVVKNIVPEMCKISDVSNAELDEYIRTH